ncbi:MULTISPECIES: cardiolipin synthase [unclassified Leisingera]|uniref:cardiolipin synthase n=1 Tax=unclassified Leisingera TaxID=2614906 RepID=UPI0002D535E4|nr:MULTISPECIES: cardiolipin synthase [unclassified Leisingera]KIC25234.1 cardiolipin synthase [Leisingera sp. ANG-S3]KIC54714.1 cardiolipin synthase [Leisingera sp. ANG-S]KID10519.1 cardiolipin synthase [Leisingera sp. ANG1]
MFWIVLSTAVLAATWTAAGLAALSAARTARTPQGAIGWVVFLLAAPVLALPAYMIFGHHRFKGYWTAREAAEQAVIPKRNYTSAQSKDASALAVNTAPFEAIAGQNICRGNGVDLLVNGTETFKTIFEAIENAQDYILLQYYILRADNLGMQLQSRLIAAAERGVTVWFMTDSIGSRKLSQDYKHALVAAGINMIDPAVQRGPWHRLRINFRNHRKTVIVDGHTGFTGGLNVGNEYLGQNPEFGPWRDTHVRLVGPVVLQLQLSFAEDWHWRTQEPILDLLNWEPEPSPQNLPALIASTGPGDTTGNGSMLYFSAITAAQRRVWLASPYFVPDQDVFAALKHAGLRGIDVRVLLPETIDHHLPWLASFAFFDELREAGVRILRYQGGFMHQKCFVVDDTIAGIGTANLDNRSFRLNFETMALFFDQETAGKVANMLAKDFRNAKELAVGLGQQNQRIRLLAPMARLLAPVL